MICDLCKGKGWVQGQMPCIPTACSACSGKVFVEPTNDDWRRTCSIEEYATWLWKNLDHADVIILWEKYGRPMYKDDNGVSRADYTEAMKRWLMEKR